jgi:hypothetical protein
MINYFSGLSSWEACMNEIVKNYEKVGFDILKKYSTLDESVSINECLKVNGALNHDFCPV